MHLFKLKHDWLYRKSFKHGLALLVLNTFQSLGKCANLLFVPKVFLRYFVCTATLHVLYEFFKHTRKRVSKFILGCSAKGNTYTHAFFSTTTMIRRLSVILTAFANLDHVVVLCLINCRSKIKQVEISVWESQKFPWMSSCGSSAWFLWTYVTPYCFIDMKEERENYPLMHDSLSYYLIRKRDLAW